METTTNNNSIDNSKMFRRIFSFNGRIRRMEFGIIFVLFCFYRAFLETTLIDNIFPEDSNIALYFILLIPGIWIFFAEGTKRCHDLGHSGFYMLIPFYGFVMLFCDGDKEDNEYGNSPKDKK